MVLPGHTAPPPMLPRSPVRRPGQAFCALRATPLFAGALAARPYQIRSNAWACYTRRTMRPAGLRRALRGQSRSPGSDACVSGFGPGFASVGSAVGDTESALTDQVVAERLTIFALLGSNRV